MLKLFVVLSLIGIGLCHEEFQCTFENENLDLSASNESYTWGKSLQEVRPLVFEKNEELETFLKKLTDARRRFWRDNTFNDFDSIVSAYGQMEKIKAIPDEETFKKYIEDTNPSLPASDSRGLLVKFFRNLGEEIKYPQVSNHYYIALKGVHIYENILDKINEADQELPIELFEDESLTGIIKVKVENNIGYVIINVDDVDDRTPVVFEEDGNIPDQEKNFAEYVDYIYTFLSSGRPTTYELIGKDKDFVESHQFKVLLASNNTYRYVQESNSVIYLRPVCSINKIQNRINLEQTTVRSIVKNGQDLTVKAYLYGFVTLNEEEDEDEALFTIGIKPGVTDAEWDALSEDDKHNVRSLKKPLERTERYLEFDSIDQLTGESLDFFNEAATLMNIDDLASKVTALRNVILKIHRAIPSSEESKK